MTSCCRCNVRCIPKGQRAQQWMQFQCLATLCKLRTVGLIIQGQPTCWLHFQYPYVQQSSSVASFSVASTLSPPLVLCTAALHRALFMARCCLFPQWTTHSAVTALAAPRLFFAARRGTASRPTRRARRSRPRSGCGATWRSGSSGRAPLCRGRPSVWRAQATQISIADA